MPAVWVISDGSRFGLKVREDGRAVNVSASHVALQPVGGRGSRYGRLDAVSGQSLLNQPLARPPFSCPLRPSFLSPPHPSAQADGLYWSAGKIASGFNIGDNARAAVETVTLAPRGTSHRRVAWAHPASPTQNTGQQRERSRCCPVFWVGDAGCAHATRRCDVPRGASVTVSTAALALSPMLKPLAILPALQYRPSACAEGWGGDRKEGRRGQEKGGRASGWLSRDWPLTASSRPYRLPLPPTGCSATCEALTFTARPSSLTFKPNLEPSDMTHTAGIVTAIRQLHPQLDAGPSEPVAKQRLNRQDVRLVR